MHVNEQNKIWANRKLKALNSQKGKEDGREYGQMDLDANEMF